MFLLRFIVKLSLCGIVFSLFSCYSSPENINGLIDYSDTVSSKNYDIGITIFNNNLIMLKQNVFNEIIQNNGEINREEIQSINRLIITISMPKSNTANFISKIKMFGIIIDEKRVENNLRDFFDHIEMRLANKKNMLEKYNELLQKATEISDKIMLEKEINDAKSEIEMIERNKKEMELRIENNTITILMYNK